MTGLEVAQDSAEARPLDLLAKLVLDAEARSGWLIQQKPEVSQLFGDALMLIGGLVAESKWDVDTLLSELGCFKRSEAQLKKLSPDELAGCCAFFEWIRNLLGETPSDQRVKRTLISTASTMYGEAQLQPTDWTQQLEDCQGAMRVTISETDPFTPTCLVRLGEIGTAFQVARAALPGLAGANARELATSNPFSTLPMVHVRITTIDALLWWETEPQTYDFNLDRAARLRDHIPRCDACREARIARTEALGISSSPRPVSFEPLAPLTV